MEFLKKYWWLILILLIIIIGVGYYLISPLFIVVEINENLTQTQQGQEINIIHESIFQEKAHEVKGKLKVINDKEKTILSFENFESINGPNLHVWISKDLDGKEYYDLGPLKGTKGNFSYDIPKEVNLKEYKYVLIWCVPFKVLFSFATLF
ncbi:MAG TPA: DM13 domain-containing protein [Candidatus Nanoarchaeia archaeon]|nr:DM13 domain-containing protein [Candidatus Nanoarchaeia archaeon]